ncbi:hypothetical protein Hdeb2414_s0007g00253231 [Helianthus debilis subsp. tardiflorus]
MVYIILRGFQMVLIDETLGIQLQMYRLSLKFIIIFGKIILVCFFARCSEVSHQSHFYRSGLLLLLCSIGFTVL